MMMHRAFSPVFFFVPLSSFFHRESEHMILCLQPLSQYMFSKILAQQFSEPVPARGFYPQVAKCLTILSSLTLTVLNTHCLLFITTLQPCSLTCILFLFLHYWDLDIYE